MKTYDQVQAVAKLCWELNIETEWWADYTADDEVKCVVRCSDFFWWGCSDDEEVELADIPLLREAHRALEAVAPHFVVYTGLLFCAWRRQLRPQGAAYKSVPKETWPLFDACGRERETDFMNPVPRP